MKAQITILIGVGGTNPAGFGWLSLRNPER